jgi:hypothetical protein
LPARLLAVRLARFTASAEDIAGECRSLLRALRVPFGDIRGMGITVGGKWPTNGWALTLLLSCHCLQGGMQHSS